MRVEIGRLPLFLGGQHDIHADDPVEEPLERLRLLDHVRPQGRAGLCMTVPLSDLDLHRLPLLKRL